MPTRTKDRIISCRQIDEFLDKQFSRPPSSLPRPVRLHIQDCRRCEELYSFLHNQISPGREVPSELLNRILRTMLHSLRPVSPLPPTRAIAARFLALFLLLSLAAVSLLGAGALEAMTLHQLAAVTAILGVGAALLAVSLSWQMVPGSYARVRPGLSVIAFIAGFLAGVALLFPWRRTEVSQFVALGLRCSAFGLILAIPAGILLGLVVRRGAVLCWGTAAVTIGLLGGLVGVTVLQFQCTILEATHLVVWHGGVLVVSAAAGFLLESKL